MESECSIQCAIRHSNSLFLHHPLANPTPKKGWFWKVYASKTPGWFRHGCLGLNRFCRRGTYTVAGPKKGDLEVYCAVPLCKDRD